MRYSILAGLAAAVLFSFPEASLAQPRVKVKIDRVQVGFPIGSLQGEFKTGCWTPVFVDVTAGPEGIAKGEVIIDTADTDDVKNNYRVPLPPLDPNEATRVLTYTKPGSINTEIITTIKIDNHYYTHKENYSSMQLGDALFVMGGGSRSTGLKRAFAPPGRPEDAEAMFTRDTGPRRFAFLDDVKQLPTRWFAYEPVDLLILTTGNRDFITALLSDRDRREALAEWVRWGGHLVVAAGRNQDVLASLDSQMSILPAAVTGNLQVPHIRMGAFGDVQKGTLQSPLPRNNPKGTPPPLDIAKITPKPGREFVRLLPDEARPNEPLLIVRGAYGLGQVTLVAFDLDQPPFTGWTGQSEFWRRFLKDVGPRIAESTNPQQPRVMYGQQDDDIAGQLEKNLEQFPDVPVISFGWVALFILIYILVVGPLDYFFLKKVVKRLELTWITFPTVVITISVASYFIAYYLKGDDQLVNKVDLIDVDVAGRQVHGHTWFTIFSPRIQHYTIGVEPADPDWAPASPDAKKATSVMVTWLGRPDGGWSGVGRAQSQSLFRRTYEYEPDATALRGVPIQVWTTKSFSSEWQVPFDPANPLFRATLHQPPERQGSNLSGTVTSGLPVDLEDVTMFYRKKAYFLDRLVRGVPKRVDSIVNEAGLEITQWLNAMPSEPSARPVLPTRPGTPRPLESLYALFKRLEFFEADPGTNRRNNSLRQLDQSWRLGHKEEIIVVGRVARMEGPAEDVCTSASSPSRLWLGSLPTSGQPRQKLPGSLTQETYVRVIIPVKTEDGKVPEP